MKHELRRLMALILSVVTFLSILPLSVSADCNHTFSGNVCTYCGYSMNCTHPDTSLRYSMFSIGFHEYWTHCNVCGSDYGYTTDSHIWNYGAWSAVSGETHERNQKCVCGSIEMQSESHNFLGDNCSNCGYTKMTSSGESASVFLSASGPSGTLGPAGGEIAAEEYPASYTVSAEAVGCTVTHIVYTLNDRAYTEYGSSVTVFADSESDFQTSTFTAYTDVSGVTATFTVNFKYARKSLAYVMWETSEDAVIRSITGNGMYQTLSYPMTIPNSYDSQGNLTEEQVAVIQGLIGRNDGLTYMVNYTRTIWVYTPAEYSSTGAKQYHASYDGNNSSEIADCLSRWGWTSNTQAAIQQAAASSLSFTTGLQTDCSAMWIDTSTGDILYSKVFGLGTVTPSQSIIVSVSYSEYADADKYVYEELFYAGDTSGTSTSQTYSQTYTVQSSPLTVTFYCHPENGEDASSALGGSITVTVYDAETYSPISGASVSGAGQSAASDISGCVLVPDLPFGSYEFTAEMAGYCLGSGWAAISAENPTETVVIYLYREYAETTGSITVCVRDVSTYEVLANAFVSGSGGRGYTDSYGLISFSGLGIGEYDFSASLDGYYDNSASASVSDGAWNTEITLCLVPIPTTGVIFVDVRDQDTNEPLSGAVVTGGGYRETTSASGMLLFSNLPFAAYTFSASKAGYESGTASAAVSAASVEQSITIWLKKKDEDADAGIAAQPVDGTVYRGSTIMVSADVYGDAAIDFTPENPLTVTMKAVRNGGTVFDTQTKSVICPKGETNLVWFTVDIPETGYTSADVTFRFTVTAPATVTDVSNTNDVSSKTVTTYVLPERSTPDANFEINPPADFTHFPCKTTKNKELFWTVWEWDGGFEEKTYSATLAVKAELTPDATAVWSKYNSVGKFWTTRSGYGLNTAVTVALTGVKPDMFAGNAKVNAYYPEFGYSAAAGLSNMLLRGSENAGGYTASFSLDTNADTISGSAMHLTPVWFPDGEYSVKFAVYDIWTPAGMLTSDTFAVIYIEGSMYDDYYTQRN